MKERNTLKDEIIFNCLEWFDLEDKDAKSKALMALSVFAKMLNVKIGRKVIKDQKKALRDFVKNDSGYVTTMNNLYNSLI